MKNFFILLKESSVKHVIKMIFYVNALKLNYKQKKEVQRNIIFKEKKLKINNKVSIKYSVLNLFDDDKNQYVDEKRILNIEKI